MSRCHSDPRPNAYKSRQDRGSGGLLSASGITCSDPLSPVAGTRGLRTHLVCVLEFIFIPEQQIAAGQGEPAGQAQTDTLHLNNLLGRISFCQGGKLEAQ